MLFGCYIKLIMNFLCAQQDLALIRNETSMFLMPPQPPKSTRQRRGSQVGLAALATFGLSGGGLALGSSDSCGLLGLFRRLTPKIPAACLIFKLFYNESSPSTEDPFKMTVVSLFHKQCVTKNIITRR